MAELLLVLDILFSLFFVGPFTVLYWRGTFVSIVNVFIIGKSEEEEFIESSNFKLFLGSSPDKRWIPSLTLYLVGLLMKMIVDLIKNLLKKKVGDRNAVIQTISKIVIIYNDALFGVVFWAGGFNILYVIFPSMLWYQLLSVFLLSSLSLFTMNAFKCTTGTPITIIRDTITHVFTPSSYFSESIPRTPGNIILDTIFSYLIVHSLVICCWWSVWEMENNFILQPCEIIIKDFKAYDSVLIAFILATMIFGVNDIVKTYCAEEEGAYRGLIVMHLVSFAAFLTSLNFWRGIWSLMDFYFFPDMMVEENLLLSHLVGFLWSVIAGTGMTLTQSSALDPKELEYNHCQYWRRTGEQTGEQPTETSPLMMRNL